MFDFYRDNSIGRCRYTNIVAPYYRALHPKTYYTDRTIPQPQRAIELINEALAHHKANGFDFSPLTADNQGFVYAMNVYYAGPVTNNWAEGLWPHAYHLGSAVPLRPGQSAFDYQFTAMGAELELGTFCHENGHMLCDYPDLYDYGVRVQRRRRLLPDVRGQQRQREEPDCRSAPISSACPAGQNTVTPLEHDRQVTLAAGSNDFALYSRGGREYFLIENRQKAGRDASLPDAGTGDLACRRRRRQQPRADDQRQPLRTVAGAGGRAVPARAPARPDRRCGRPVRRPWGALRRRHNPRQQVVERHLVEPDHRPDLGRRRVGHVPLPAVGRGHAAPDAEPGVHAERAIPDNNPTGISDTIDIAEALTISSVKVGVDITHTYRGDLRVTLTTPWGTVIELQPKGGGGNAHDLKITYDETTLPALATLRGRSTQGAWRLTVQDLAPADTGRLNRWSLEFSAAASGRRADRTEGVARHADPGPSARPASSARCAAHGHGARSAASRCRWTFRTPGSAT